MPVKTDSSTARRSGAGLLEAIVSMLWVGGLLWLFNVTHYRDQVRAQVAGKAGIVDVLRFSPQLLHDGNVYQTVLFVWLWVPLIVAVAFPMWIIVKRRQITRAGGDGK